MPTLPADDANFDIAQTTPIVAKTPEPIFQHPDDPDVVPMEDVAPTSTVQDPDATPEDAAALVTWESDGNPEQARHAFTEALKAHADDPEWPVEFYNQLGTEKTAEMTGFVTGTSAALPNGEEGELNLPVGVRVLS